MLLSCSQVRAVFAPEGLRLQNDSPVGMWWDEHGGTFVLKVTELAVLEAGPPEAASGIRLELALPEPQALLREISGFASQHQLLLAPPEPRPAELSVPSVLAAFHVPGQNLFIYCEDPELRVRVLGPQTLELAVTGEFRCRRVPCREPDVVIHLTGAAMSRLLSYCAALLRTLP